MSNYCTSTDIKVLLGYRTAFSASTYPTLTEVEQEIDNVTNEIDFYLAGVGISTQPTDARILGRLRKLCGYGVAGLIGQSRLSAENVDGIQSNDYLDRYRLGLDEITKKPFLYGVVTGDSNTFISNQVIDGTMTEDEYSDSILKEDYNL